MPPSTAHCSADIHRPQQSPRTIGHNSYCASSVGVRLPRGATPEAIPITIQCSDSRYPGLIPLASVADGLQGLIRTTCRGTTDVLNHDCHGDFWHFVSGAVWLRCVRCGSGAVVGGVAWPWVTWFDEGLSHRAQSAPNCSSAGECWGWGRCRCRSQPGPACGNCAPEVDWCHISWHGECPQTRLPWPSPHEPRSGHVVGAVPGLSG